MSTEKILYVCYPYEDGDKGIPEGLVKEEKVLTEAIEDLTPKLLDDNIEIYETKKNVAATSEGLFVACFESDVELDEEAQG